jgi:mono/diheme cytochrome c family protein
VKPLPLWLLIPAIVFAQGAPDPAAQGEKIFNQTCATGYCHGAKGVAAGAPRLVGRGFNQAFINTTVARGIAGTAMPAFGTSLNRDDLAAVVGYVAMLNGTAGSAQDAQSTARPLSPDAVRGRDLISDATRSFGRCATCHEVNGIGIPVATPIAAVPPNAAALRALASPHVRTAAVDGETFPALVIGEGKRGTILYDLTSPPPVQRSLEPGAVKLTDGSTWKHSSTMAAYNDPELNSILAYLRETVR